MWAYWLVKNRFASSWMMISIRIHDGVLVSNCIYNDNPKYLWIDSPHMGILTPEPIINQYMAFEQRSWLVAWCTNPKLRHWVMVTDSINKGYIIHHNPIKKTFYLEVSVATYSKRKNNISPHKFLRGDVSDYLTCKNLWSKMTNQASSSQFIARLNHKQWPHQTTHQRLWWLIHRNKPQMFHSQASHLHRNRNLWCSKSQEASAKLPRWSSLQKDSFNLLTWKLACNRVNTWNW